MNDMDISPEELATGRRDALVALAALASDDTRDVAMATGMLRGADPAAMVFALLGLVLEVLADRGENPAAWIAREQEQAALSDA